jgi:hypothetical protein
MVMDVVVAVKKKDDGIKNMGPPRPCSGQYCSQYSMSRTCGPQDMVS